MTAYNFTSRKQLKNLLNDVEGVQKHDIHSYAGGHLNEAYLYKPPSSWASSKWTAGKGKRISLVEKSTIPVSNVRKSTQREAKMKETLYDFSVGTTGSLPLYPSEINMASQIRYKNVKTPVSTIGTTIGTTDDRPESTKRNPSAASKKSIYTELQDGVLVEELKAEEVMLPGNSRRSKRLPPMEEENEEYDVMENIQKSLQIDNMLTFRHQFLPTHHIGVTKRDQYEKLKSMEDQVIGLKDASEQHVLSGVKAVKHLEKRLQEELETLDFIDDHRPNFHKLQVYSNVLEDLIEESPTFSYILREIKTEYDNYISKLLDQQSPDHTKKLRTQVELMVFRGTSRPKELEEAENKVVKLEDKAKSLLENNERLRKALLEEEELLAREPSEPEPRIQLASAYHEEPTAELADEIEHVKALILEKLDDLNALRTKLREEYVPLTVCTHLEQCIKETEVEVQKLLKQNEYLERSISEMETDLREAIQDADTSERDARRIWRKVNSRKGLPHMPNEKNGTTESDDDDDDESKWNWYIS
ncbi:uncharacterized protein LOC134243957 [Saccostrea cucullata]|uniref:uncharacterized protein LOC134243957 n=1 Tax=Saccostrea cuccullata TaxID=36930 RepID=UPI002ED312A8